MAPVRHGLTMTALPAGPRIPERAQIATRRPRTAARSRGRTPGRALEAIVDRCPAVGPAAT